MSALALAFDITARDRASATFDKVGDAAERTGRKGHAFGKAMGAGLAVAGVAAVAFGKKAVDAAVEGELSHARLAKAIENSGGSMKDLGPKVDALSTKFAKFGYENDAVESGLATMTTALHDPKKAMDAMGLAADLAATKHVDLETASLAVAKAMQGQLRPLKQLGIDLPVSAGGALKLQQANDRLAKAQAAVQEVLEKYPDAANAASKHHAQYEAATAKVAEAQLKLGAVQEAGTKITTALAAAVGGQASAAADTYAGKAAAMRARMANLTEEIGIKLLPVISTMIEKFSASVDFLERHRAVVVPLVAVLGSLAAVVYTIITAAKIWTAVQTALNIVLSANPIGLVVIAIAALAAGLVLAWKHSETFRDVVKGAFSVVLGAVDLLLRYWQALLGALGHVPGFGWAKDAANKIGEVRDKLDDVREAMAKIPTRKFIEIIVRSPSAKELAGVGGSKGLTLEGARAGGGPVRAGAAYLVGERGPEVLVMPRNGFVLPNAARKTQAVLSSFKDERGRGINRNINNSKPRRGLDFVDNARLDTSQVIDARNKAEMLDWSYSIYLSSMLKRNDDAAMEKHARMVGKAVVHALNGTVR